MDLAHTQFAEATCGAIRRKLLKLSGLACLEVTLCGGDNVVRRAFNRSI